MQNDTIDNIVHDVRLPSVVLRMYLDVTDH